MAKVPNKSNHCQTDQNFHQKKLKLSPLVSLDTNANKKQNFHRWSSWTKMPINTKIFTVVRGTKMPIKSKFFTIGRLGQKCQ